MRKERSTTIRQTVRQYTARPVLLTADSGSATLVAPCYWSSTLAASPGSTRPDPLDVGRRERQIIEIVYGLGRATVSDVLAQLPDPPSYSAVRGMLNKLEVKGHLSHVQDGPRFVYV